MKNYSLHKLQIVYASAVFTGALSSGTSSFSIGARMLGGAVIRQGVDNIIQRKKWSWKGFRKVC